MRLQTHTDNSELGLALNLTKLVVGFDREHARVLQEHFRDMEAAGCSCCGNLRRKNSTDCDGRSH